MKAEVKILVEYNHCDDIVFLSSRGVEGDGLPLHIYIGMLQALCQMQKQYNDRQLDITLTLPSEVSIASARDEPTSPPRIEVPPVPIKETPAPPMGFQQKFPTVEELIDGVDGEAIKRFAKEHPDIISTPTPKTVVSVPSKKPKRYTVEQKTEIAMMYASGQSVKSIAEKFGREPQAIRLLIYKMGVKRGDNPIDDQQADASKPASKGGSVLKNKPWYLKK